MTPTESRGPAVEGRSSAPIAVGLALWSGAHVLLALPWAYAGEGSYHPWALAVTRALRYGGAAMALVAACRLARRLLPRTTAGGADGPSGASRPRPRLHAAALVGTGLALMLVSELPSLLVGSAAPSSPHSSSSSSSRATPGSS